MKLNRLQSALVIGAVISLAACEKDVHNIADTPTGPTETLPVFREVIPTDINQDGFDFMEKMQGQWVGKNRVIADDYEWFSFDYRAISASHVHGIFEGGTMGNLLTSFFVTDFKDTRTIMARNGGVLNGIYRSSYFVLDSVSTDGSGKYYRFVDAVGGIGVMSMELKFNGDSLYFNAYTSKLGNVVPPTRHMTFKAQKNISYLAETVAQELNYPQNIPAWDFSDGFNETDLYVEQGNDKAKSATFLSQVPGIDDVITLGQIAADPFRVEDHPTLSFLNVALQKNDTVTGKTAFVYLSESPLTDEWGAIQWTDEAAFNSVLKFPEIIAESDEFLFTYLHPGDYYVNVVMDQNQDGFISPGDVTSISQLVTVTPEDLTEITISNISIQN